MWFDTYNNAMMSGNIPNIIVGTSLSLLKYKENPSERSWYQEMMDNIQIKNA